VGRKDEEGAFHLLDGRVFGKATFEKPSIERSDQKFHHLKIPPGFINDTIHIKTFFFFLH
jgi:hypothetical protein